ncbi:MAG: hypothetical protein HXK05_07320 [Actinomyces graevenitzii]|jgi:hypothetical protein|uniref:Uncharacterized protein n=1 Tax=Actinomyces graevenitzii TaxID=55565 RepID=A0A9E7AR99_9ACTO|nr:hypothetical protein [Actinomyces graevenitzii]UQF80097.1 MAG: hypothetical protein M3I41_02110 [Actinomyces graevenitzii]
MKRILAIALAFLTLVAGALLAPAATAAEKIETKILFALNADGSSDELVGVYSDSDTVVNASSCKDTGEYVTKFTQKNGTNQCFFGKHHEKGDYDIAWIVSEKDGVLEFDFLNLSASLRVDIASALSIYSSELNVISTAAALPLNATVTDQTLSPTTDKSDKFIYYIWEGSNATKSSASLKGTLPLSGATSNPTSDPTSSPTNTPEPALTATASATPSAAATGATATALATNDKSKDSNTTLYVVLGIVGVAAVIGIVVTVVLVKKRKSSTPAPGFYPPASPTMPYNGQVYPGPQAQQGYRGPQQPQGYPGAQQQGYPSPQQPQANQPRPGQPPYGANPNYPQNRN